MARRPSFAQYRPATSSNKELFLNRPLRPKVALALVAALVSSATLAATAAAVPFTSSTPIAIPDSGPASPYPSPLTVSGLQGRIAKVTATLHDVSHSCYPDLDVLLVNPAGRSVRLMSDAATCDGVNHVATLTFDDAAPAGLSCDFATPVGSGSYKPTDDPAQGVDAPACSTPFEADPPPFPPKSGPASETLSSLVIAVAPPTQPQVWNLFVHDDEPGDAGTIGGWTLNVDIAPPSSAQTQVVGGSRNGSLLKAVRTDSTEGGSLAFQWLRCDSIGNACAAIAGATGGSYQVTSGDIGRTIRLRVTVTNSGGTRAFDTPHRLIEPLDRACGNLIQGTTGPDSLAARDFNARLVGLAGDDTLRGSAGADCLAGGTGDDRLSGGDGRDYLRGGPGADRLRGGAGPDRLGGAGGADVLDGGKGRDVLNGGAGSDRIDARDGRRETVRCGNGDDRVLADLADKLIGCEEVRPKR
jgi:RTX calcium-binding nonapeptide repeat (4 copies)